jgi:hypothetical protein
MQDLESAGKSIFLHLLKNQNFSKEVIKEMENQNNKNKVNGWPGPVIVAGEPFFVPWLKLKLALSANGV